MNGSEKYILLAKIDTGTRNKKETVKNIELATIAYIRGKRLSLRLN